MRHARGVGNFVVTQKVFIFGKGRVDAVCVCARVCVCVRKRKREIKIKLLAVSTMTAVCACDSVATTVGWIFIISPSYILIIRRWCFLKKKKK